MGAHRRENDKLPMWRKLLALCAAILAVGVMLWWLSFSTTPSTTAVPTEAPTPTPSVLPSLATTSPSMAPTVDQKTDAKVVSAPVDATGAPVTITSGELGFKDTPLATMQVGASDTDVVPPIDNANPINSFKPYWISNLGAVGSTSQDTGYIIGHACTAGCTPEMLRFNRLSDLKPGNVIGFVTEKGKVECKVTHSVTYDQQAPASEKGGTWGKHPGYVILISCYPGDFHGKSTSVFAKCEGT